MWLAQLPFGLAQLWWDRRHDVSEQGYLEWLVTSFFSLGGVFLFVCVAILIVMALARPLRRPLVDRRAPPCSSASASCSRSSGRSCSAT